MNRRVLVFFLGAASAALLPACTRAPAHDDAPAPTVSGDRILFPANSPQRAAIVAVAAEPRGPEVRRLSGRVVWDEEATVRVYSPVAGRVAALAVALGDRVEKDAVLLRIDSPDFGQAQADVRKANADALLAAVCEALGEECPCPAVAAPAPQEAAPAPRVRGLGVMTRLRRSGGRGPSSLRPVADD